MIELETQWVRHAMMGLVLASVHVWFPWFDRALARHLDRWIGFIGGIATGYVTLYMLPKLARISDYIDNSLIPAGPFFELRIYLVLTFGIACYLVMEQLDSGPRRRRWLAITFDGFVHGAYSFLIGYVLIELSNPNPIAGGLILCILAAHLLGMNHILRDLRPIGYDRMRWLFAALVLAGVGTGIATELPKTVVGALTAFLAGIILVNVMSEELPRGKPQRITWYLVGLGVFVGAAGYILAAEESGPV